MTSNTERFPSDIQITIEDFKNSGWEEAFQGNRLKDPGSISEILAKKGQKAAEENKMPQSKVLWLLADICSMMLQPSSVNEPFKPYFTSRSERSAITNDFSEEDIDYFLLILPAIAEPWLKARLCDLIWLKRRSRTDLALVAIDSYLTAPITLESFVGDGGYCWIRAIQLTRILKHATDERMKDIHNRILEALRHTTEKDGFLARWLSDLLKGYGLGASFENEIAEKLLSLAEVFKEQSDFYRAREYYEPASYWFSKANKENESFKAIAYQAEAWNVEAEMYELSENFQGAAHCLENAIQTYRSIPNKHRANLGIEKKLSQLQSQLHVTGKRAAENMTPFFIPLPDNTSTVAASRLLIHGKPFLEALKILANLYPGAKKTKIRESAEQALTQFHFGSFFGLSVRSHDGRIIAKTPGIANVAKGSKEYEEAVWKEMLQTYYFEIGSIVPGRILPALEAMIAEHRLQERDFASFCSQSSIVPPSRSLAFGKALFAGYDLDFDSAIHRLVPQVENMVRYHLKAARIVTTTLDRESIEMEINLSALLDKPEALLIFGEDLIFEMKALFCESRGPNFRHHFAHGLLEDSDFCSVFAVYAWCFTLRLVFNVFWNTYRKE